AEPAHFLGRGLEALMVARYQPHAPAVPAELPCRGTADARRGPRDHDHARSHALPLACCSIGQRSKKRSMPRSMRRARGVGAARAAIPGIAACAAPTSSDRGWRRLVVSGCRSSALAQPALLGTEALLP